MASTILIRHAQASFGTSSYDRLSQLGIRQAVIAGEYLGATADPVARIVSGPLKRQRDTAAEIAVRGPGAAGRALQVEIDDRLDELNLDGHIERIAPKLEDANGELARHLARANTSSRSYQKVIQRVFEHWQQLGEETAGESRPAFAGRAQAAILELRREARPGETTIAVSSGVVIATITQYVLGLPDTATYSLFEVMRNCSLTHLLHSTSRLASTRPKATGSPRMTLGYPNFPAPTRRPRRTCALHADR